MSEAIIKIWEQHFLSLVVFLLLHFFISKIYNNNRVAKSNSEGATSNNK